MTENVKFIIRGRGQVESATSMRMKRANGRGFARGKPRAPRQDDGRKMEKIVDQERKGECRREGHELYN